MTAPAKARWSARAVGPSPQAMADAVRQLTAARAGVPPSTRELAAAFGMAKDTVRRSLSAAEAAGLITRRPGSPRSIVVVKDPARIRR